MKAFVEQIDGGVALVRFDDGAAGELPVALKDLPEGVRAGDVLAITFTVDTGATREARDAVQSLIDSLPNEP